MTLQQKDNDRTIMELQHTIKREYLNMMSLDYLLLHNYFGVQGYDLSSCEYFHISWSNILESQSNEIQLLVSATPLNMSHRFN